MIRIERLNKNIQPLAFADNWSIKTSLYVITWQNTDKPRITSQNQLAETTVIPHKQCWIIIIILGFHIGVSLVFLIKWMLSCCVTYQVHPCTAQVWWQTMVCLVPPGWQLRLWTHGLSLPSAQLVWTFCPSACPLCLLSQSCHGLSFGTQGHSWSHLHHHHIWVVSRWQRWSLW